MGVNVLAITYVCVLTAGVARLVLLVYSISSLSEQSYDSSVLVTAGYCTTTELDSTTPFNIISFGSGPSSPAFSSQSLSSFGFTTTLTVVSTGIPQDGQLGLMNAVPANNGVWHAGIRDHTTDVSGEGYMILVNAALTGGQFSSVTLTGFTVNAYSRITLYVANIVDRGQNLAKPELTFELYSTGSGNPLVARVGTGAMKEANNLSWQQVDLAFVAPTSSVTLVMRSNVGTGTAGVDFVLDDIQSRTCPPRVSLAD